MQAAGGRLGEEVFPCEVYAEDAMLKISVRSLIRAVTQAVQAGMARGEISRRFHAGLVAVFTRVAEEARRRENINAVVLSGGVFQNRLLLEGLVASLGRAGFLVLGHQELPCNDGCISLGQAVIGREALKKR
jgi:hydrogenase maturation protein HypF